MNKKSTLGTIALATLLAALALIPERSSAQIAWRATSTATMRNLPAMVNFQAAGTAVTGSGNINPAWPAHQTNDVALLFCESANQTVTLNTANGFAAVTGTGIPPGTGTTAAGTSLHVFWARATSSAMASPSVGGGSDHKYCQILTYRGVITSGNPWDVTLGGTKAATSTSVTVTGVTTTQPDTLIVQAVAHNIDSAGAQFSAQNGTNVTFTERVDAGTNSGNGGGFGVWDGPWAGVGATGNTTATVGNSVNAFVTIALQPAPQAAYVNGIGTGVGATGTANPAWPAHAAGDIGLLFCESANENITLTTANGFAAVPGATQGTGAAAGPNSTRLQVWWARATSGAMAAPVVADPGNHVYCRIVTVRGAIASGNPWEVVAGGVKATASTSVSMAAVTTTIQNTLIVHAVSHNIDNAGAQFTNVSNANLSGLSEDADAGATSGNGGGIAVWDGVLASPGNTGNTTATVANSVNAFVTIAFVPDTPRIAVPAGTQIDDVMIASIVVRPSTTVILPPSGWTAMTPTVQAATSSSRQRIFWRIADATDAAGSKTYQWAFDSSSVGAAGAIVSYRNVDTLGTTPIDVIGGNVTPSGTAHTATAVTTNVPNTMVISSHAFSSSERWTPPAGMTERVDISTETPSNTAGISLSMNEVIQSAVGTTGNKTATAAGNADAGTAQILALRPALHHYAISALATTVANCDYAEITITGHASNDGIVAPSAARKVTLSVSTAGATAAWQPGIVSGTGTWTPSGQTATYQWPGNETSFTVRLRQSAVVTLSVNVADDATPSITEQTSGGEDPDISFVTSAFRISNGANAAQSIGTQIAAKPNATTVAGSTYFLQAVRTDSLTGACTSVFTNGSDVTIQVGAQCINPASCTENVTLTTNAAANNSKTFVPAGAASFPQTIDFRFSTANAEAPFIFNYADAGQIRLQFRYVTAAPAVTITGNSNNFVVRPFGFAFRGANASTTIAHGNTNSAPVLAAAGDPFTMTLGAYKWASGQDTVTPGIPNSGVNIVGNGLTPNFSATLTTITATANVPGAATGAIARTGSCNAASSATITSGWSGGAVTLNDFCYSEAGNVFFTASSDDYLSDTAADITGNSGLDGDATANGYVGRFRPKKFAIAASPAPTVGNRAAQLPACVAPAFTYMGESLDLGFTLQAQNEQGGITQNYTGTYAKFSIGSGNFNLGARDGATNFSTASRVQAPTASGSWSNGAAAVALRTQILRAASPDGPYTAVNWGIAPTDSDGVAMGSFDLNIGGSNDRKNLGVTGVVRFGRLRQQNAFASSGAVVLPVPIELQYWNGTTFTVNSADTCTTIPSSIVTLTPSLSGGSTSVSSVSLTSGSGFIRLSAPGAANTGFVLVTPDLTVANQPVAGTPARTYLQGNWTGGAYDQNPSNRAAWGLFGSAPKNFIYQRENY
jgi:hypothetical protein